MGFALKRCTFWILFVLIIVSPSACLTIYLIFGISPTAICKWPWHPVDITLEESMTICSIDDSQLATQGIMVSLAAVLITLLNVTMCCMFVSKLRRFVPIANQEDGLQDKIKEI